MTIFGWQFYLPGERFFDGSFTSRGEDRRIFGWQFSLPGEKIGVYLGGSFTSRADILDGSFSSRRGEDRRIFGWQFYLPGGVI